jgi:hypothetical protein
MLGLVLHTISCSCSLNHRVPRVWGSDPLNGVTHKTGPQWPKVVPLSNPCFMLLTFMIPIGTSWRAWTSILALYSHSGWEIFKHNYTRLFAYSRGPSSHAITTLVHQTMITSSLAVTRVRIVVGLHDTVTPLPGPVIACGALNPPLQYMLTEHPVPRWTSSWYLWQTFKFITPCPIAP